jgi:hypothetical protein
MGGLQKIKQFEFNICWSIIRLDFLRAIFAFLHIIHKSFYRLFELHIRSFHHTLENSDFQPCWSTIKPVLHKTIDGVPSVSYVDSYSGSSRFRYWPGHRLSWLRLSMFFRSLSCKFRDYATIFSPEPFPLHQVSYPILDTGSVVKWTTDVPRCGPVRDRFLPTPLKFISHFLIQRSTLNNDSTITPPSPIPKKLV